MKRKQRRRQKQDEPARQPRKKFNPKLGLVARVVCWNCKARSEPIFLDGRFYMCMSCGQPVFGLKVTQDLADEAVARLKEANKQGRRDAVL